MPLDIEDRWANDIEALMHVFDVGSRADWDLLAARKTLDELADPPDAELRNELLEYALQLVDPPDDYSRFANDLGHRLVEASFTVKLRDRADRELIGNAVGLRCDVFCTSDRRSIIRRREALRQLPIKVLTPVEWWARVKPWARLWGS